jgi:hypothetical protein
MGLRECKYLAPFPVSRISLLFHRLLWSLMVHDADIEGESYSMIILAAWCLVPGHPGFVFKESAVLERESSAEEPKLVQEAMP